MVEISALCFDIDGTLIDDNKTISQRTAEQIKRYVDRFECRVILASSRMPRSLRLISSELGVDCDIVAYDGAHCSIVESSVSELRFDTRVSNFDTTLLDCVTLDEDLFCGLFYGDEWIVSGEGRWLDRELRSTKTVPDAVDESLLRQQFRSGRPFSKLMFRGASDSMHAAKELANYLKKTCTFYSNKETIIEFVPITASKASGAAKVLGETVGHLPKVIAFGDGYNDVKLMEAAEFSVSMGNAVGPCRKAAKFTTLDNNSEGIAKFLQEFFP